MHIKAFRNWLLVQPLQPFQLACNQTLNPNIPTAPNPKLHTLDPRPSLHSPTHQTCLALLTKTPQPFFASGTLNPKSQPFFASGTLNPKTPKPLNPNTFKRPSEQRLSATALDPPQAWPVRQQACRPSSALVASFDYSDWYCHSLLCGAISIIPSGGLLIQFDKAS